jgi:hypothetical protein
MFNQKMRRLHKIFSQTLFFAQAGLLMLRRNHSGLIAKLFTILAVTTLFLVNASHAELKGGYQLNKNRQKLDLYYADDQHIRADLDNKGQLVMKGADIWLLKRQGEQWLAVNADQVGGLLKAAQTQHPVQKLEPVSLRATDRSEVVAGYKGRVYIATSGDKTSELVLTDNLEVLALTSGWRKLAVKVGEHLDAEQAEQLQQVLNTLPAKGMGGLLREGDNLILVAVDNKITAVDADFPANTQMLKLPKLQLPNFN